MHIECNSHIKDHDKSVVLRFARIMMKNPNLLDVAGLHGEQKRFHIEKNYNICMLRTKKEKVL